MGHRWIHGKRGQESRAPHGMSRKFGHAGGEHAVADLKDQHKLDGFSGRVGRSLKLRDTDDGRREVRCLEKPVDEEELALWESFCDAVTYAREAQHREEYLEVARERNASPLQVATADFLHAPEIHRIDLSEYHGRVGDRIRVFATDDVEVTRVGILITDGRNHLVEMGMARRDGAGDWTYQATRQAPGDHVRVIVDAADLPGHLTESRAEKNV